MAAPRQQQTGAVVIGLHELERLRKRFGDLREQMQDTTELVEAIGNQQAESARRRIANTKRDPSGKRWKAWSRAYAKTRKAHHSTLVSTGTLRDSITYRPISPSEVQVGSTLNYAGVHLRGSPARKIPQRAYLDTEPGFADSHDRAELRDIIREFWRTEMKR